MRFLKIAAWVGVLVGLMLIFGCVGLIPSDPATMPAKICAKPDIRGQRVGIVVKGSSGSSIAARQQLEPWLRNYFGAEVATEKPYDAKLEVTINVESYRNSSAGYSTSAQIVRAYLQLI